MPDLGAALFQLGDTTARTAVAAFDYLDRVQQRESQAAAIQRLNQLRRYSNEQMPTLTTGDPDTWLERVGQTLQTERDRLAGDLSPDAAQAFYQMADDWFTGTQGQVATLRNQAAPQYHHGRMMDTIRETAALSDNWIPTGMETSERQIENAYLTIPPEYRAQSLDDYRTAFRQEAVMQNVGAAIRTDPRTAWLRLKDGQFSQLSGDTRTVAIALAEDAMEARTTLVTIQQRQAFGGQEQEFHTNILTNFQAAEQNLMRAGEVLRDTRANAYSPLPEIENEQNAYNTMARLLAARRNEINSAGGEDPPAQIQAEVSASIWGLHRLLAQSTTTEPGQAMATLDAALTPLLAKYPQYQSWITSKLLPLIPTYVNNESAPAMRQLTASVNSVQTQYGLDDAQANLVMERSRAQVESLTTGDGQTPFYSRVTPEEVNQITASNAMLEARASASEGMKILFNLNPAGTAADFDRADTNRGSDGPVPLVDDADFYSDREKLTDAINRGDTAAIMASGTTEDKRRFEAAARQMVVDFATRANLQGDYDIFDMVTAGGKVYAVAAPRVGGSAANSVDYQAARYFRPFVENNVERWYEYDFQGQRVSQTPITISDRRRANAPLVRSVMPDLSLRGGR